MTLRLRKNTLLCCRGFSRSDAFGIPPPQNGGVRMTMIRCSLIIKKASQYFNRLAFQKNYNSAGAPNYLRRTIFFT